MISPSATEAASGEDEAIAPPIALELGPGATGKLVLSTLAGTGYLVRMQGQLLEFARGAGNGPVAPEVADVARRFIDAWANPEVDRFMALLAEDVVLVQPVTPRIAGRAAARVEFMRLLRWLPDLRGTVDHWAVTDSTLLVAWRLGFSVGGKRLELPIVDRIVVRAGLIAEREAYFDPLPLLIAVLIRPHAWPGYLRYRGLLP